ncbi:MAG TPA: molybdate ABC transporter substrate-binding protein [Candidatus Saccharimonadales bacterium]|nr:molybdate ABC transporter substrate-binding protein [Candidatus Saccharimonadales bacterium]
MRIASKLAALLSLFAITMPAKAQTLRVAAAADLQYAMRDLAAQFEKQSGIKVVASYGSSGNFRSQIQNGAPFDVFFSADADFPNQLVSGGFADAGTLTVYAHGHLVLWSSAEEHLDLPRRGFETLNDPRVKKIAIANADLAPYGRAAVAALKQAGLYDAVKPKLIFGENISQAAQFAQSRSAQVGILALSLTFADSMKHGEKWVLPANLYPVMAQAAVVVRSSTNKKAAQAFLDFVMSREGQQILTNYGLSLDSTAAKP